MSIIMILIRTKLFFTHELFSTNRLLNFKCHGKISNQSTTQPIRDQLINNYTGRLKDLSKTIDNVEQSTVDERYQLELGKRSTKFGI